VERARQVQHKPTAAEIRELNHAYALCIDESAEAKIEDHRARVPGAPRSKNRRREHQAAPLSGEAYRTLRDPKLRARYDASRTNLIRAAVEGAR
jgi:hypothetical protein